MVSQQRVARIPESEGRNGTWTIDLRTNRAKIRRGVVRVGGEFIIGQLKSDAGVRDVAIPPRLMPLVKDHLSHHTAPSSRLCHQAGGAALGR
jgi:hypothetical protein